MSVNVNQRMAIILSDLAFGLGQQIEAAGYKLALGPVFFHNQRGPQSFTEREQEPRNH